MGMFHPFIEDEEVSLYGVEAAGRGVDTEFHAASLTKGKPGVLHGSLMYLLQNQDGQIQEAHSISAGLDYPGIGPMHANLFYQKRAQFMNATDDEALDAAFELAKLEGIITDLVSAHALAALNKIKFQKQEVVVVNLSGRGDKDMDTYMKKLFN